jgi:hypothetical protein
MASTGKFFNRAWLEICYEQQSVEILEENRAVFFKKKWAIFFTIFTPFYTSLNFIGYVTWNF